jgi:four helix bundle protein
MKDFHDLKVWQKAHGLTLLVYRLTRAFPRDELYGLTSQIRRACASIPANLAEGCGRSGDAELARFCAIAMGSASELEYHLLLAKDLNLLSPKDHQTAARHLTDIRKMLTGLRQTLKPGSL